MKCGIVVFYIVHTIFFVECDEAVEKETEKKSRDVKKIYIEDPPSVPRRLPAKSAQFQKEIAAGNYGDIMGPNEHIAISDLYKHLGRRFVPQYPYYEREKQDVEEKKAEDVLHRIIQDSKAKYESEDIKLLPVKASPEFVLAVAQQSKILEDSNPANPTNEVMSKNSLRAGKYWDGVWKEELNPNILRTEDIQKPKDKAAILPRLGSVRTKIMPGTRLYQLIFALRKVSPKFLYVMNVN